MSEFRLSTDLANNCFIKNGENKFGMFDKLEREQCLRVIEYLNNQEERISEQKKLIDSLFILLSNQAKTIEELTRINRRYNDEDRI